MVGLDYFEDTIPIQIKPGVWMLCDPDTGKAVRVIVEGRLYGREQAVDLRQVVGDITDN